MKYQAEYRTVSGKFYQRTFETEEAYNAAKLAVTGTKRQGVEQWTEEVVDVGTLDFVIAMDKVEGVIFRVSDEEPEGASTSKSDK